MGTIGVGMTAGEGTAACGPIICIGAIPTGPTEGGTAIVGIPGNGPAGANCCWKGSIAGPPGGMRIGLFIGTGGAVDGSGL